MTTVLLKKNECYGELDRSLGQYENQEFLKDMKVGHRAFVPAVDDEASRPDETMWCEGRRQHGLEVLQKLIRFYVDEDRVEAAFKYVVAEYDAEWRRYRCDHERGLHRPNSEDYRKYSWRGNGPKPYFEGLILAYLKKAKYHCIDD